MGQYFETRARASAEADLMIFNHGHNTDNNVPASTHMGMDLAILYTMLQRHPCRAIIVFAKSAEDSDNGIIRSNGARQAAITAGFSLVDVFQLFQNAGKPSAWYMDNIHPMLPVTRKFSTWLKSVRSASQSFPVHSRTGSRNQFTREW